MEDLELKFVYRNGMISQSEAVATATPKVTLRSFWSKWLRCIKNWLPVDYRGEMVQLVKLAGPVVNMGFILHFVVLCRVCLPKFILN